MPSPRSVPADLLVSLAAVLSKLQARWYVFGAQAVILWGRPRLMADIDVTVRESHSTNRPIGTAHKRPPRFAPTRPLQTRTAAMHFGVRSRNARSPAADHAHRDRAAGVDSPA